MPYKLLLADDSITVQRVIELTFSREDVEVVSVGDGESAIARMGSERPDIVLADVGMARGNGYEVAAYVKGQERLKDVPVLLLSGAFEPLDTARAEQAGYDGVLVKPFEPQHVIARVLELLHRVHGRSLAAPAAAERAADTAPSRADRPVTAPPAEDQGDLDDYFARLDAAFDRFGPGRVPAPPAPEAKRASDTAPVPVSAGEVRLVPPQPVDSRSAGIELPLRTNERVADDTAPATVTPPAPGHIAPPTDRPAPAARTPVSPPVHLPPPTERAQPPTDVAPPAVEPPASVVLERPSLSAADVSSMLVAAIETAPPLREVATVSEPPVRPPEAERPSAGPEPPPAASVWSYPGSESAVPAAARAAESQPTNGRNAIAEAFAALLAIEQGERGAPAPSLEVTFWAPVMTSAFVDEVARRVIERLAPEAAQGVVERVVSDVAERLVREEMGRVKSTGRSPLDGRS